MGKIKSSTDEEIRQITGSEADPKEWYRKWNVCRKAHSVSRY